MDRQRFNYNDNDNDGANDDSSSYPYHQHNERRAPHAHHIDGHDDDDRTMSSSMDYQRRMRMMEASASYFGEHHNPGDPIHRSRPIIEFKSEGGETHHYYDGVVDNGSRELELKREWERKESPFRSNNYASSATGRFSRRQHDRRHYNHEEDADLSFRSNNHNDDDDSDDDDDDQSSVFCRKKEVIPPRGGPRLISERNNAHRGDPHHHQSVGGQDHHQIQEGGIGPYRDEEEEKHRKKGVTTDQHRRRSSSSGFQEISSSEAAAEEEDELLFLENSSSRRGSVLTEFGSRLVRRASSIIFQEADAEVKGRRSSSRSRSRSSAERWSSSFRQRSSRRRYNSDNHSWHNDDVGIIGNAAAAASSCASGDNYHHDQITVVDTDADADEDESTITPSSVCCPKRKKKRRLLLVLLLIVTIILVLMIIAGVILGSNSSIRKRIFQKRSGGGSDGDEPAPVPPGGSSFSTLVPSITPMAAPESSVSIQPTLVPSVTSTTMTDSPSTNMTVVPTLNPTTATTTSPIASTIAPTFTPSAQPSAFPSRSKPPPPSESPNLSPSPSPSPSVTVTVTGSPTNAPTVKEPTTNPSLIPTTEVPTLSPSMAVSEHPSSIPSSSPAPTALPSSTPSNSMQWREIRNELVGIQGLNSYGRFVDVSDDGNTLAVCSSLTTDNVTIYEHVNDTWVMKGTPILGPPGAATGWSLALSADGSIIAIGSPDYSSSGSGGGKLEGMAQVFEWDENKEGSSSGGWVQRGQNLMGDDTLVGDHFGESIALSGSGTDLIVAAYELTTHAGRVESFRFNGTGWSRRGDTFHSNRRDWITRMYHSISMSRDGNYYAVGSFFNNWVRVFHFNDDNDNWEQLGRNLVDTATEVDDSTPYGNGFGTAVSVANTPSGTTVAVSSAYERSVGAVRVFDFLRNSTDWIQRGEAIPAPSWAMKDGFGRTLKLTDDGDSLITASRNATVVMKYDWDGTTWSRTNVSDHVIYEDPIIAISSNAETVVASYPFYDKGFNYDRTELLNDPGRVRTYDFTREY